MNLISDNARNSFATKQTQRIKHTVQLISRDVSDGLPLITSHASAVKIGCIGDSITAGVHSSGGNHTYPFRLQMALDAAHGFGAYTVSNLFVHDQSLPQLDVQGYF